MTPEATFHHVAHGSIVASNRMLPLFPAAARGEPATVIWSGDLEGLQARWRALDWPALETDAIDGRIGRRWRRVGEAMAWGFSGRGGLLFGVLTTDGRALEIGWRVAGRDQDPAEFALRYVLPKWLGWARRLAGQPVLHGNAVLVGDQAIAWVGEKTAGKSTLAAGFVAAGHTLLADDQLVLWPAAGSVGLAPGLRRLHLGGEAAGVARAPLELPFGAGAKGYVTLADDGRTGDGRRRFPLAQLHVLQPRVGEAPVVGDPLGAAGALNQLVRHTLGRTELPLDRGRQEAELRVLASLVPQLSLRPLTLPDDLAALPAAVAAVSRAA
jgi:hypothetical protein